MAFDTVEMGTIYDALETKAAKTLSTLFDANAIQNRDRALIIGNIVNSLIQTSVGIVQRQPQIDQQLSEAKAKQTFNVANVEKQGLLLDQQLSEAKAKQTFNVANVEKQGLVLDEQIDKLKADTELVKAQELAIEEQVIDNRKIKALDIIGETYSGAMTGGLVVTADMWTVFYSLAASLFDELKSYKGAWDATVAFTPPAAPLDGDFFNVSVEGTINVDGTSSWAVGDLIYFDGTKWKKSPTKLPTNTVVVKA